MADLLLVEDSADIAELLAELLRDDGNVVRIAAHGLEGLQLLDERFPQVVISDLDMPVLDGPSMVYRMFVTNVGRENIPIVFMSGSTRLREIAQSMGTPYYISKPFKMEELVALIHRALVEAVPPRLQPGVHI